jgi:phage-related protein
MFTFKGINATTYGTVTILPIVKKPSQKVNIIGIEGADKAIREELGLDTYVIPCQMVLFANTDLDDVKKWLNGGGQLILASQPTRYINVFADSELEFERFSRGIANKQIDIEFTVIEPFYYSVSETPSTLSAPGNIINFGNIISKPILKITGTGTVTVTINTRSFTYNFDTPFVIVDSELQDAYHNGVLKNRRMTGNFPFFDIGTNAISWTGTITSIEITKVSRWI